MSICFNRTAYRDQDDWFVLFLRGIYGFRNEFMGYESVFSFPLSQGFNGVGFCIALVENRLWVSLPKIVRRGNVLRRDRISFLLLYYTSTLHF